MFNSVCRCAASLLVIGFNAQGAFAGSDPFADAVVAYQQGSNPTFPYVDPATALGSPERISGELFGLSDTVSVFSPPYAPDEIVSIGAGGFLTVAFNEPVINDANNLYGIDLLIFGNTFFVDGAPPAGIVSGYFGNYGGIIDVSQNGEEWFSIPKTFADGLFPRTGYADAGPYDQTPGRQMTDFTRPVDPTLTLEHFMGFQTGEIADLYRGSGGGIGIDLSAVGLSEISFVRISVAGDATDDLLIDGFTDVSPRLPGDINLDGIVDVDDLLELINSWGSTSPGDPPADFNLNGLVDVDDLFTVINNWSE